MAVSDAECPGTIGDIAILLIVVATVDLRVTHIDIDILLWTWKMPSPKRMAATGSTVPPSDSIGVSQTRPVSHPQQCIYVIDQHAGCISDPM
jgi:hypothetical protein